MQAIKYQPTWESLNQRPVPEWFSDAKFGIFIHWGLYSVPAWAPKQYYAEWYWNWIKTPGNESFREELRRSHEENFGCDYEDFADLWKAEFWDPAQWGDLLETSGARYIVPVTKHHDGFTLWPNKHASQGYNRPWNSVETGPKRDIIGELAAEVRSRGMHLGLYYSLLEWFHPMWNDNAPERFVAEHFHPQFKELVESYEPELVWVDGEWYASDKQWRSEELLAWMFNHPKVGNRIVVNDRWSSGDRSHIRAGYLTTEYGHGFENSELPWEQCRGIGTSFGFNRNEAPADYLSSQELVWMLCDYVSRGGNFLLNIGPAADGHIPALQEERLRAIGAWLKINGEAIYGTRPWETHCQWSHGSIPGEQTKIQSAMDSVKNDYDITRTLGLQPDENAIARKQALYTYKDNTLYAFFAEIPLEPILLKNVHARGNISLLGSRLPLHSKQTPEGLWLNFPPVTPDMLPCEYIWVVKIKGVGTSTHTRK